MSTISQDDAFRLIGAVQNYAWGGYDFLPRLLGFSPKAGMTYAEYWMGAHVEASSEIVQHSGATRPLHEVIKEDPRNTLGTHIAEKYGCLPFLFKILDVREMLSIQVHPSKSAAEVGFARENALGIPIQAPTRNYKDDNHKPELELALSDFWMLHGFLLADELHRMLNQVPELRVLDAVFARGGYLGLYKYVMEMPQDMVNSILGPLRDRISRQYERGEMDESSHDYWAARAILGRQKRNIDRGIFSIYFFNLVRLRPGQAIFQDSGVPHALLQGQTLEIMASSDNTVRGGLTVKHVDVPELMKLITFKGIAPEVIESKRSDRPHEAFYETPSQEFCLSKVWLSNGDLYESTSCSAEILLALSGKAILEASGKELLLTHGESSIVFAGKRYRIQAMSEDVVLFKASAPLSQRAG